MNKLASALLALGFIPVLGTIEVGGHGKTSTVRRGAPNRYDFNNGVTVVYDETGAPWIQRSTNVMGRDWVGLVDGYDLRGGVYVPHCNDGGAFLRGRIPSLTATPS